MPILSPEAIALLKRQDADDALELAAVAGWNKAIGEVAQKIKESGLDQWSVFYHLVRSLAKQENTK